MADWLSVTLHQPCGLSKHHFQGFGIHWLEQVPVKARRARTTTVFLLPVARECPKEKSAGAGRAVRAAKLPRHLVAVHTGKAEVE